MDRAGWKVPVLVECGLGAPCHRECPGRLVGRGLSIALQVFPTSSLSSSSSSSFLDDATEDFPTRDKGAGVEGWGLRIGGGGGVKRGGFVCEMVGRLAPAARPDVAAALVRGDRRVAAVADWLFGADPHALLASMATPAAAAPAAAVPPARAADKAGAGAEVEVGAFGATADKPEAATSADEQGEAPAAPEASAIKEVAVAAPPAPSAVCPALAVDCRAVGNAARFIRKADRAKGEAANLVYQAVFTNLHNPFAPRLALFAKHDLPPGTELLR